MTTFHWEIPPVMVTSIPNTIVTRDQKFKYVASQLKVKSSEIDRKNMERYKRLEERMPQEDMVEAEEVTFAAK